MGRERITITVWIKTTEKKTSIGRKAVEGRLVMGRTSLKDVPVRTDLKEIVLVLIKTRMVTVVGKE